MVNDCKGAGWVFIPQILILSGQFEVDNLWESDFVSGTQHTGCFEVQTGTMDEIKPIAFLCWYLVILCKMAAGRPNNSPVLALPFTAIFFAFAIPCFALFGALEGFYTSLKTEFTKI